MLNRSFPAFALLILLFVVGAWEDILPGLDGIHPPPVSGGLPPGEDDGPGSDVSPAEAVLVCDVPHPPVLLRVFAPVACVDRNVREPLFVFSISHVPIHPGRS